MEHNNRGGVRHQTSTSALDVGAAAVLRDADADDLPEWREHDPQIVLLRRWCIDN